jgi:7-cyano-7-deazaguanine synthase
LLASEGFSFHLLSFNYGQRHLKELGYARLCAGRLDAEYNIVDISAFGRLFKGSTLTDDIPVPHGLYAAPNMAITVVPNRNAIMLSIAYGVAVVEEAEMVAAAFHAGDHPIYPDCRPAFVEAFARMQKKAVEGFGYESLRLYAPFVEWSKADIVAIGTRLGVPYADT